MTFDVATDPEPLQNLQYLRRASSALSGRTSSRASYDNLARDPPARSQERAPMHESLFSPFFFHLFVATTILVVVVVVVVEAAVCVGLSLLLSVFLRISPVLAIVRIVLVVSIVIVMLSKHFCFWCHVCE